MNTSSTQETFLVGTESTVRIAYDVTNKDIIGAEVDVPYVTHHFDGGDLNYVNSMSYGKELTPSRGDNATDVAIMTLQEVLANDKPQTHRTLSDTDRVVAQKALAIFQPPAI